MGMRNGLSACSSWRWQIAAPTIPWDSFCGLLKLGSTFTTRSDRTRDSIIFLRSNMLNNMLCRIFLYLPFSSVYFTGYLTQCGVVQLRAEDELLIQQAFLLLCWV